MVNKGQIPKKIRKFMMFSSKLIKPDDESMVEIGENGILRIKNRIYGMVKFLRNQESSKLILISRRN